MERYIKCKYVQIWKDILKEKKKNPAMVDYV